MKRINAVKGERVILLVVRGIREAKHHQKPVELQHNDKVVVAYPDSSEDAIYQQFVGEKQNG